MDAYESRGSMPKLQLKRDDERGLDVQGKPLRRIFSYIMKASCLLCLLVCCGSLAHAEQPKGSNIVCRPELSLSRRAELAEKLRAITGWADLSFDVEGALRPGGESEAAGGSKSARELLNAAANGRDLMVLEDASNRADVVFARVVAAKWTKDAARKPPVYLILIDFADFSHIIGDEAALAAFNAGWAVLHEIGHVVHDAVDTEEEHGVGECEAAINLMRRECGLAERAEYFFNFFPGQERTAFTTRYVRLAFDLTSSETGKKKRQWVMWDANLVGGLEASKQIAAR